ncbi:flagellar export chaperone FlgN [Deferribacteraceae bacterium V6Fe1]|nr:flagellar export chaperone FlgN [Deferribacteraceae bacterium V6Fe1]
METIQNLIGVLKSQLNLLEELNSIIEKEKYYITHWDIDKVIEVAKQKDTVIYKDRVLDEAKDKYIKKYCNLNGLVGNNLNDIIDHLSDSPEKQELMDLKKRLTELAAKTHNENLAIKVLYSTNLRLISDFFDKIGISTGHSYSSSGAKAAKLASFTRSA